MSRAPVAIVIGTRPEVIKMAPIVQALNDSATLAQMLKPFWLVPPRPNSESLKPSMTASLSM